MKIQLTGAKQVVSELEKRKNKMATQLEQAVKLAAQDVRNECVRSISKGSRTGKIYIKNGRQHQASGPGEAPKTDTGRLVNSLAFKMIGKLSAIAGAIAGDGVVAEYAKSLEFGTRKMDSRPFLVPAVEKMRPKFNERVKKIMEAFGK